LKHAWGYATDQRLRDENQDSHGLFVFDGFTLAIVCDGMGGHVGGAEASAIAVRTIWEQMTEQQGRPVGSALQKAIVAANEAIYEAARKYRRYMGMGTTVVAVALEGNVAHIAHVGDSRLYALRDGEAHLLTRDHTMVNLFVEAELLSPEDAAAHPEAHVLARSLGVEPTVEVDLQDPLELEPGDVLVLCSDGVHGPVDDAELGQVDWTDLPKGCDQVLQIVRDQRGDDNATVVALGVDVPSSPEVAPTPPPLPVDLERKAQQAQEEAGVPSDRNEPRPPMLYDEAQAAVAEAEGAQAAQQAQAEAEEVELEELKPEDFQPIEIGPEGAAPADQGAPAPTRPDRTRLIAVGAAAALVLAAAAASSALLLGHRSSNQPTENQEAEVTLLTPTGAATTAVDANPRSNGGQTTPSVAEVSPQSAEASDHTGWVFVPEPPPTRQRYSHRAKVFLTGAPGGPLQYTIIKSVHEDRCGDALDAIRKAMRQSSDYGSLYSRVWECFDDVDYAALIAAAAQTPADLAPLLPHFRGDLGDTSGPIPPWFRPPTAGLEYRLEGMETSGDEDRFAEAITDLRGPEAVADQLMRDVLLEGQAAAGLSAVDAPSREVVQWWARRVYQAGKALSSPIAARFHKFRPDQEKQIVTLLDQATHGGWSDPKALAGLPDPVRDAVRVAKGELSAPSRLQSVAARPAPKPAPEPIDTGPQIPTIHRLGP